MSGIMAMLVGAVPVIPAGSQSYTTPGTYSWVAPAGVTSVSVVCVGGGAGGVFSTTSSSDRWGGGGGGLGYTNNYSVTPGNSYTVVVGAAGVSWYGSGSPPSSTNGGNSYFVNTSTVAGFGATGATGGSYFGNGGGSGGNGGAYATGDSGGGGAGGYSGNGGTGGGPGNPTAGTGGAGGGGSNGAGIPNGAGGGGVGLGGQGTNGAAGPSFSGVVYGGGGGSPVTLTVGGSTGTAGSEARYDTVGCCFLNYAGNGGLVGGGGGVPGGYGGGTWIDSGYGNYGGVRIVWAGGSGLSRTFPSTNVGNP